MNKTILILAVVLLSSCMTPRRIMNHRDEILKVLGSNVVYKDSIIYRVDTVTIQLPPSHIKDTVNLVVNNGIVNLATKRFERGLIIVEVGISDSKLSVEAWLAKDAVSKVVHDTIIVKVPEVVIKPVDRYTNILNWYQKLCVWVASIMFSLVLIYMILKLLPLVLKTTPTGWLAWLLKLV